MRHGNGKLGIVLLALSTLAYGSGTENTALGARIEACPGMAEWQAAMKAAHAQHAVSRKPARKPKLRAALLAMGKADQEARLAFTTAGRPPTPEELRQMDTTDASHQQRIRTLIRRHGFPRATDVGTDGSNAAFLLVQHAPNPTFQVEALAAMEPLLALKEVSAADYALLFDRVQMGQGRPQRYGSQFSTRDGINVLYPVENPQTLDARRAAMDLPPMSAYACTIETAYGIEVDLSALKTP